MGGSIHQSPVKLLYFHENLYLPWLGVPVEQKVGRTLGTPEGDDGSVPHLIFSSHPLKWSIEYHFEFSLELFFAVWPRVT